MQLMNNDRRHSDFMCTQDNGVKMKLGSMIRICIILMISSTISHAQNIEDLVEKIYQANRIHEQDLDSLLNYRFKQKINFVKLDGDDEIDEQSLRIFDICVASRDVRKRILVTARDYEDGAWQDVMAGEATNNESHEARKFSLNEMFGPQSRKNYIFRHIGTDQIRGYSVIHLTAKSTEKDEEFFNGDFWIDAGEYAVIKAKLSPSDFPMGVKFMQMIIDMDKFNGHWLPLKIHMNAAISFLWLFSGKIRSDIEFYDYTFDVEFDEDIFNARANDQEQD